MTSKSPKLDDLEGKSWTPFLLSLLFIGCGLQAVLLLRAKQHLDELDLARKRFVPIVAELVSIERTAKKSSLYYNPIVRYQLAGRIYDAELGDAPDHVWRNNYGESKVVPILVNPDSPASAMFEPKVIQELWIPRYESGKNWFVGFTTLIGVVFLWIVLARRRKRSAGHTS